MSLNFERIAILGATGPTGRALAAELRGRGQGIRAVSRRKESLDRIFPWPDVEKRSGDALDEASLEAALAGCDLLVDCIGLPSEQMADHPKIAGTVVAVSRRLGARCLQVSSFWCYMPLGDTAVSERHPREGGPHWARLRREAEDILRDAGAAVLHLPDFFGPHVHTGTLQFALRDAAEGKAVNWIGLPETKREYIFVPDAMRLAADLLEREQAYGQDWVLPGAGPISGREVSDLLAEILGREVKLRAAGLWMLRLASLFDRDLRAFMQLAPEYVKPVRYDAGKLAGLLGPLSMTGYKEAFSTTLRSLGAD